MDCQLYLVSGKLANLFEMSRAEVHMSSAKFWVSCVLPFRKKKKEKTTYPQMFHLLNAAQSFLWPNPWMLAEPLWRYFQTEHLWAQLGLNTCLNVSLCSSNKGE